MASPLDIELAQPATRRLTRPPAPARAATGLVECGAPLGLCVPVRARLLTVGRAPGLGLVLDDPAVSEIHCGIAVVAGRVEVQDFGSTNGTWIDGRRRCHGIVRDGGSLQIGETVLRLFLPDDSQVAADRARLHLGPWETGRDPETGLRHGGVLNRDLARACARAEVWGRALYLALLDVPAVGWDPAQRLETALGPGARAYRHGTRRLAVLGPGPPSMRHLVRAAGAIAGGCAEAAATGYDPDRLLLAAAATLPLRPAVTLRGWAGDRRPPGARRPG